MSAVPLDSPWCVIKGRQTEKVKERGEKKVGKETAFFL